MPPKQITPKREASSRPAIDPSDLSDEARRRLVQSDGARKRAAKAFINKGASEPPPGVAREARAASVRGARARGAVCSSRAMVRREPPEEEVEGYDVEAFGRSLSSSTSSRRTSSTPSWRPSASGRRRRNRSSRRSTTELNDVFLKQAVDASLQEPFPIVSSNEE